MYVNNKKKRVSIEREFQALQTNGLLFLKMVFLFLNHVLNAIMALLEWVMPLQFAHKKKYINGLFFGVKCNFLLMNALYESFFLNFNRF